MTQNIWSSLVFSNLVLTQVLKLAIQRFMTESIYFILEKDIWAVSCHCMCVFIYIYIYMACYMPVHMAFADSLNSACKLSVDTGSLECFKWQAVFKVPMWGRNRYSPYLLGLHTNLTNAWWEFRKGSNGITKKNHRIIKITQSSHQPITITVIPKPLNHITPFQNQCVLKCWKMVMLECDDSPF